MILVVQLDQRRVALQSLPYLGSNRIAGRRIREPEDPGSGDDVNLARIDQAPDREQRPSVRLTYAGGIRNEVKPAAGTGDADVEHTEPASFPGIPAEVAVGHPAPAGLAPAVFHEVKNYGVEFPALKPVRSPDVDLRAGAGLIQHILDKFCLDLVGDDHACCRSEKHTSELQSQSNLVCRLLLE